MRSAHVYVHIPYCAKACSYCYYVKLIGQGRTERAHYIEALRRETAARARQPRAHALSVYIGGGTPMLLTAPELHGVVDLIAEAFAVSDGLEFSVETTPAECRPDKLALMRGLGANRLSIGVQSIDDRVIAGLNRARSRAAMRRSVAAAVEAARQAGFANINCDLILGLPGETDATVDESLAFLVDLGVAHVSLYPLQVGISSPLFFELAVGRSRIGPQPERRWRYRRAIATLIEAGYRRVGIAYFARHARWECRHHTGIWNSEDLIGLGVSAQSFEGDRYWRNTPAMGAYLEASPDGIATEEHRLGFDDLVRRWAYTQLSRKLRLDLGGAEARWGEPGLRIVRPLCRELVARGLARRLGRLVALTDEAAEQTTSLFSGLLRFDNQDYAKHALRLGELRPARPKLTKSY